MGHAVSKSKPRKRPPLLRATALKGSLDAPSCPSPPGDSLAAAGEEGGSGPSSRHQDGNAAAVAAEAAEAAVVPVVGVALPAGILAKEKLLRVS
jgi:hypothetical protein